MRHCTSFVEANNEEWVMRNPVTAVKSLFSFLVLSVLASGAVQAQVQQTGLYFGVDVMEVEFSARGFSPAKPTAVSLATGYRLSDHFAAEARAGAGLSDASSRFSGVPVDIELDSYYGFYAKGMLPLSDIFELFATVGYSYVDIKARAAGGSMVGSDNGFSYGLGGALKVSYSASLQIEWGRLLDSSGFGVDALAVGMRFSF